MVALGERLLVSNKHSETKTGPSEIEQESILIEQKKRTNHLMPIKQENDTVDTQHLEKWWL